MPFFSMAPPSCETQVMNRQVWLMKNGLAGMNECLLRRSELRIAIAGLLNIKKSPRGNAGASARRMVLCFRS